MYVLVHILKQLTHPAGLASLNSGTGKVLSGRGQLGSILSEEVSTLFPFTILLYIIYLWIILYHVIVLVQHLQGTGLRLTTVHIVYCMRFL